ncbi:hypothetical protein FSP39_019132 [Pinctada imbricata]|uniref:Cytosolic endo-beta-N-acetylglucosaminidase TIM barrel domain-containing protein n=1 Tax=Pinctada imbricata TaxID=66713 RepID=A0AA88XTF9_PINIB|nr:hypothetical protein FSP39_019132 [Pinctada imbricata]
MCLYQFLNDAIDFEDANGDEIRYPGRVRKKGGDLQQDPVAASTAKHKNTRCKNTKDGYSTRRKRDTRHVNIKHKRLHINRRDQWATGADFGRPFLTQVANGVVILDYVRTTLSLLQLTRGLEERTIVVFPQGSDDPTAYRFYHWQYIDMFIYFSHHFVTIPPSTWTNAAHRNGVQMLGTVITEWQEGLQRCKTFLESESAYKAVGDKLVSIATYYKFDGWLINIENPIQGEKLGNLHGFVKYLAEQMHDQLPGSTVLWYDSVIRTGELKWQDALNEKNKMFFDVCDGIFLNYNWNDEKLFNSLSMAKGVDRSIDVFVGIDVFGRGCLGGGGFNTIEALQAIRRFNMSAAIFAQGWVYENQGREKFTENENK